MTISSFKSYVLIMLFKLSIYLSYYCRWINELYRSLFFSCTCILCLLNSNLTLLMGTKWWSGGTRSPMTIWEVRLFFVMQAYLVHSNYGTLFIVSQVTLVTSRLLVTWHNSVLSYTSCSVLRFCYCSVLQLRYALCFLIIFIC